MKSQLLPFALVFLSSGIAGQEQPVIEIEVQTGTNFGCCGSPEFSADGKLLASLGHRGITIWDVESSRALRTLRLRQQSLQTRSEGRISIAHPEGSGRLAFSPTGSHIALLPICEALNERYGKAIDVWTVANGEPVGRPVWIRDTNEDPRNVTVPWSWSEMLSWGASRDQAVVTDLARFAVGACPITVDGKLGVVAVRSERDRSISAVDVFSIPDQRLISRIQTGQASRIELSARGRFLAAISPRGQLTVFETARGRALPFRESYGMPGSQVGEAAGFDGVGAVAFAPDERLVAVSTRKAALLFDTSGMRKVGSIPFDEGQSVRELRFSPDSKVVAFSGGDGIRLWGVNPIGETARLLAPRGRELTSLTFSPDGKTLAVGTSQEWVPGSPVYSNREGIVDVWDLSGVDPPRVLGGHTGTVRAIGFAADGARLVVATSEPAMSARSSGQEGEVVVWDVQRARRSRSIEPPGWESSADAVAVSPDGRLAAAGIFRFAPLEYESEVSAFTNAEYLGEIRIWEEPDGPILRTFSTGESTMFALGFSPNANRLATAHEGLVSLWDVDSGRRILDLKPGTRYPKNPSVRCLAFLNRERLVSGDGSGEIHVWDTRSGTKLEAVPAHSTEIRALAIDPKGQLIASGGCSGELRLWQIERWSSVATSQHATTGCVIALAFSPDGRWLASAGEDGVVRMWDRSGRWQLLMVTVPHSNEWIVAAPDGSYEGTAPSWLAIRRGLAALPIEDAVGVRRVKGLLGAVLGISRP